ncbi:hypothetical protein Hanom_Chr13g01206081 [Helianthus anomalus]
MILRKSHVTRFRKSQGVTVWYQSFDCSELGFLLESRLQSLGLSHENIFKKYFSFHFQNAKIHGTNVFQRKDKKHNARSQLVYMSSSESGLSEEHDPMAIVSDDEVAPVPEPFALPDFGDDVPLTDGFPVEDPFVFPAPIQDHLIIAHPDGEHIVAPILDVAPLMVIPLEDWPFDDLFGDDVDLFLDGPPADVQGDGEVEDNVAILDVPPPVIPVVELSSDSSLRSVSDSFESVTSSALQVVGLQLYANDSDDGTVMSIAPLSPARDPTPPHDPETVPEPDPVPFGQHDIAPLIPDPIPAPP